MSIPRTFVLTIKRRLPEFEAMRKALADRGIAAEPFLGMDSAITRLDHLDTFDLDAPGGKIGLKGVTLCLHYYQMWKVLSYLEGDRFWVLEDDAEFDKDWRERYDSAMAVLPDDWDVVFMGSCCTEGRPCISVGNNLYESQWPMCTHAMMYRKKALPTLLEVHEKIWAPIDIAMVTASLPKLRVYTILPRISYGLSWTKGVGGGLPV